MATQIADYKHNKISQQNATHYIFLTSPVVDKANPDIFEKKLERVI